MFVLRMHKSKYGFAFERGFEAPTKSLQNLKLMNLVLADEVYFKMLIRKIIFLGIKHIEIFDVR